jgi:YHS domain-containing protein
VSTVLQASEVESQPAAQTAMRGGSVRRLLKVFLPYSLLAGLGVAIWVSHRGAAASAGDQTRWIDPVCHMEVNPAWGFQTQSRGRPTYFCTAACRDRFAAAPEHFLISRCVVCNAPLNDAPLTATYLGKPYPLCSAEHRQQFKADPAAFFMHTMWGIPTWMYYASIAVVLLVSFGIFEGLPRRMRTSAHTDTAAAVPNESERIDLLANRPLRRLATSRAFRFFCQAVMVGLFFLIVAAGWKSCAFGRKPTKAWDWT